MQTSTLFYESGRNCCDERASPQTTYSWYPSWGWWTGNNLRWVGRRVQKFSMYLDVKLLKRMCHSCLTIIKINDFVLIVIYRWAHFAKLPPLSTRIQSSPEPIYEHGYWGSNEQLTKKHFLSIMPHCLTKSLIFQNIYVFTFTILIMPDSQTTKQSKTF